MSLTAGTRLGPYEIVSALGAGGMGEVYRARDARLNRDVALKVLPAVFADDPSRMARFEREAQVLASLNHPNIAALYGLEESNGVRALVMELVEGETLQGPLPLDEVVPVAKQIAEALEYAHDCGVIHRDLKPANIKVTPNGTVKLLDFGLAKALDDDPVSGDSRHSPTLSLAATRLGVILGTAAYMAPEQAKGKPVDRRADIWSFGVVVAELLIGKQLYSGDSVAEILASVMLKDPPLDGLPAATPPALQTLLRRCLEKDPRRRLQAIGEARLLLEDGISAVAPAEPAPPAAATGSRRPVGALAGALLLCAALGLWGWLRAPQPAPKQVMRWTTPVPQAGQFRLPALSPDGSRLLYIGVDRQSSATQVYLRTVDQLEARPLPVTSVGIVGGYSYSLNAFFSPDGQWIAYISQNKLKKVPVTGGAPITLCDAGIGSGGSWGTDNTILFSMGPGGGLRRVPAAGGAPQDVAQPDTPKGEAGLYWPQILPGGQAALFTVAMGSADESRIALLDLRTGERRTLLEGGSFARYAPTGHLVYARGESLFAVSFDLAKLQVTGSPTPVLEGVAWNTQAGFADFSFPDTGTLVYAPGGATEPNRTLVWVDRKGTAAPIPAPPRTYNGPRISPDGKRVALYVLEGGSPNVWIYELERGTLTRLTFQGDNRYAVWTPDGRRVTYRATQSGKSGIYWAPADGSGAPELLSSTPFNIVPGSWTPDGQTLVYQQGEPPDPDHAATTGAEGVAVDARGNV
jgi:Tol biopolymer transport system component